MASSSPLFGIVSNWYGRATSRPVIAVPGYPANKNATSPPVNPLIYSRQMATAPSASLNGHGIFAVIVFACVTLIVIRPLHIPIPLALSRRVEAAWDRLLGGAEAEDAAGGDQIPVASVPTHPPLRRHITLNHVSAPIVGILFLLVTGTIGGEQVRAGIVGSGGVEPYDVLALFIGLAYIAISLDATGLLRYLALQVSNKGGRSGPRLFYLLYAFFFFLGLLVGNDPVVLSGTPFLAHFTRVVGITRPDAWIWAQFTAANISSAMLVSSNPTNIVIASGFGVEFTTYSAFMALPTLASGVTALLVIRVAFASRTSKARSVVASRAAGLLHRICSVLLPSSHGKPKNAGITVPGASVRTTAPSGTPGPGKRETVYIPRHLIAPDVCPREALADPQGAIFGSVVMACTLAVLVGTSVTGRVKVYQIALPGAALCLARDLSRDLYGWRSEKMARQQSKKQAHTGDEATTSSIPMQSLASKNDSADQGQAEGGSTPSVHTGGKVAVSTQSRRGARALMAGASRKMVSLPSVLSNALPTVSHVFARLPLPLLPFVFGMFILVESLDHVGFIDIMAGGLGNVCARGGDLGASFFLGFLTLILCNLGGTNIGSCILLVRAVNSPAFTSRIAASSPSIIHVASYSLALGSNVGGLGGTFSASLAGLLWKESLRQSGGGGGGIRVRAGQFFVWSAVTAPPSLAVGLLVVWAQVRSGKWPM